MPCSEDIEKEFYRLNPPPSKDELVTISRKDFLAVMPEEAREKFLDLERKDKELREQAARLIREHEERQEPPARKGWRQPRKKNRSKKTRGD